MELTTILATIHVKNEIRAKMHLNETRQKISSTNTTNWDLVISVAGEDIPCHVTQIEGGFKVNDLVFICLLFY